MVFQFFSSIIVNLQPYFKVTDYMGQHFWGAGSEIKLDHWPKEIKKKDLPTE